MSLAPDYETVLSNLADSFAPPSAKYLLDPMTWANERLGEQMWSKQIEIMQSVVVNRRTAVKSCHGVGKSWTAARLICWWIDTHPIGEAFVVSTAPSNEQVEAVLWREINKAFVKAKNPPLPGRMLVKAWKIGNEMVGYGRKPADYDPTGFQGIHARYVLVILDEACGIPEALWTAAGALITNEHSRILAIGNPDDPTSHFAKVCRPGSSWNILRISAMESPNFTGEPVTEFMSQVLVSQSYLEDLVADGCGPGTPVWSAKVEGEFPEDTEDSVVRPSAVAKCRLPEQEHEYFAPVELGVDVGAGGDLSVIMARFGPVAKLYKREKTPDTMRLVGMILEAIDELDPARVKIDKTGVGQGVVDRLNEHRSSGRIHCEVIGVMVGAGSSRPERFPKLRDQIWWEVGRMMSENGAWDLSQLDDAVATQLTATRWQPDSSGRIKVERKEETKKRLGRSPDDADALLLTFYAGGTSSAKAWLESLAPPCPFCSHPNNPNATACIKCGKELIGDGTGDPKPEEFSLTSGIQQQSQPPTQQTQGVMEAIKKYGPPQANPRLDRWR